MTKDKRLFYILSGVFTGVLLLCCFAEKVAYANLVIALLPAVFAALFGFFVKKRSTPSHNYRQVLPVMFIAALTLIAAYLLTGLGFGLQKTPVLAEYFWKRILPYGAAILCAEYIRSILLSQETKYARLWGYLPFLFLDLALFRKGSVTHDYNAFLDFFGMTVLPAVAANLLYVKTSEKYGFLPVIAYRIPLAVYPYLLPLAPQMPEAMLAFFRVILPLAVLGFLHLLYGKKPKTAAKKYPILNAAASVLGVLVLTAFVMLISCRFQYGALVIATESMTGSLNKGDAIIYERYDDQPLKEGQVIVFSADGRRVVHRIVRLQRINGQLQIFTKGDANEAEDIGFITADDVIGTELSTIPYLGYPTVWVREMFHK